MIGTLSEAAETLDGVTELLRMAAEEEYDLEPRIMRVMVAALRDCMMLVDAEAGKQGQ